ncbi:thioredoxin family protein [Cellulomonas sp. DKR-3]|uniref:Thioredoxin family protein n=1 Tax=Cellulomonas fulva TaxID=2835530 RepID=A0ABS5U326_9CELL|nr:thioredoxin family protein [Cellulomonas fulva]MBT0995800.1 thioredoxin family protein [Cellulomonas fulva]
MATVPRARDGETERLTAADLGVPLGERATLVEFSSRFCQPCRAVRLLLERAVATTDDVRLVDLDVAQHTGLGERFVVTSTPTVLVLDASGTVRARATGVPSLAQVRAALASLGA